MVEKCANPACSARFHTLREGRVFVKEVEDNSAGDVSRHGRQLRYAWLCEFCCKTMTVVVKERTSIEVVPLSVSEIRAS